MLRRVRGTELRLPGKSCGVLLRHRQGGSGAAARGRREQG